MSDKSYFDRQELVIRSEKALIWLLPLYSLLSWISSYSKRSDKANLQFLASFQALSMPEFKRPESLPFPTTYWKFSSPKNAEIKFRIQEIPEELFDKVIDILKKNFFGEETIHVSKKIAESPEQLEFSKGFYRKILDNKLSIGCFDENSGELVAVNVMAVESKNDEKFEVRSLIF